MSRVKELLKNTITIAIGTISTKLITFILVPLYTIWLTPNEYGIFDLINTYVSFIIPFATLQLQQSIFRFSIEKKNKAKNYLSSALVIILFNLFICNILIYILIGTKSYFLPFLFYFNMYALYNCFIEYLRGVNKLKFYSLCNILVSLALFLFILLFHKFKVEGILLSFGISYLIGNLIIIIKEKIYRIDIPNKEYQKEMIKFSIPLIPNSISWWITNVSDRTIIKIFIGSFYNGIYAVSCKIPLLISYMCNIFNLSWQSSAVNTKNDKDKYNFYNLIYSNLINLLYLGSFIVLSLTPIFFKFFIKSNYFESIYQIPILLNGIIFLGLSQFLGGIFIANKESKIIGKTTLLAAIINIIINILSIKYLGLYAASISTMISYLILFLYRYLKLKKIFNKNKSNIFIIIFNIIYIIISISIYINNIYLSIILSAVSILIFIIFNYKIIKKYWRKRYENINN